MARERMVTRTITTTEVSLMVVNTKTAEVETHTYQLSSTYKDEKAILKAIEKRNILPADCKAVQVLSTKESETIYGMSEQTFMTLASVMDEDRHFVDEPTDEQ